MAELSLWLDNYNDIYSDFDSRHYQNRRVSDDFFFELRNGMNHRKERIQDLILVLPASERQVETERIIKKSRKDHFLLQLNIQQERCRRKRWKGVVFGVSGVILMLINTFIGFKSTQSALSTVIRVLLEPGSWFLLWASFDFLFYDWKELKKERGFYERLSELNIHFRNS